MTATSAPTLVVQSLGERIRRFVFDRPAGLRPGRYRHGEAVGADAPLAAAVLAIPGIAEVTVSPERVEAVAEPGIDWAPLEERVAYAIGMALRSAERIDPSGDSVSGLSDDAMFDLVERLLERDINPAVAGHGGRIDLLDVQDATVVIRMMGGCQGCGMANVTLRQGIEQTLRRVVPGFRGLRDVTDHASGTNPYF